MFHTNLVRYMRIKDMYDNWPKHFCHNEDRPWLNVSESQMRRIMKNECEPTFRTKMKLSDRLGVELFELTKRDDKEEGARLYEEAAKKGAKTPDDFDKFFDEEFEPAFKVFLSYHENRERRERIKFAVISVCGFIAVSAWFAMLFVALQS